MARVKICGLTRPEDIEAVNLYRPDYIGFVFAESKRMVDKKTAERLADAVSPGIRKVGVFVDADINEVLTCYQAGIINIIQLHGSEGEAYIRSLQASVSAPIIKAVKVRTTAQILDAQRLPCDGFLFDTYQKGACGGTGTSFDWSLIPKLDRPFFLAGGLRQENLAQALEQVSPFAVDISSGAETNGKKDPEKIRRILEIVRGEMK